MAQSPYNVGPQTQQPGNPTYDGDPMGNIGGIGPMRPPGVGQSGPVRQPGPDFSGGYGAPPGGVAPAPIKNPYSSSGNWNDLIGSMVGQYPKYQGALNYGADGKPTGFNPMFQEKMPDDVHTGANFDQAQKDLGSLHDEAWSTGLTKLGQAQIDRQQLDEQNSRERAMRDGAAQTGLAEGNLAMRGGLSGGARERVQKNGGDDTMMALQGVGNAGQMVRGNIGISDAGFKQGLQTKLPGMYQGLDEYKTGIDKFNVGTHQNVDQFNINTAMGDVQHKADNDLGRYGIDMNAIASGHLGDLIGGNGAGGGGGMSGALGEAQGPIPNELDWVPGTGTINGMSQMAQGKFGENDVHYEDMLPGVGTFKAAAKYTGGAANPQKWSIG